MLRNVLAQKGYLLRYNQLIWKKQGCWPHMWITVPDPDLDMVCSYLHYIRKTQMFLNPLTSLSSLFWLKLVIISNFKQK